MNRFGIPVACLTAVLLLAGCVTEIFRGPVDTESYSLFAGPCDVPPPPAHPGFDTELQPQVVYQYATAYPPLPPWAGPEGSVRLRVLVDCSGRVTDAIVGRSSGNAALDSTALDGIYLCRFAPEVVDNRPVASWIRVRYDFVPAGSGTPLGHF